MKNKRIFARIIAVITLLAVILTCVAFFAACNKNKTKSVTDIFRSRNSYGELKQSKLEFTLPAGWEVYTNSTTSSSPTDPAQNSDVGYIPEIDAFIVSRKFDSSATTTATKLSILKCGDNKVYHNDLVAGMLFHPSQGIRALRYKDGLIVCLFDDGTAGAFDARTGAEVLSRQKIGKDLTNSGKTAGYTDTTGASIDSVIKILCGGLIAVHYNYDHVGGSGYTAIFRPQYSGAHDERGELVCRIKNSGALSQVNGFDDKYASVSGTSSGEYMFRIPDHAPSEGAENIDATSKGSVTSNSNTNYSDETTYIGGGRFYVCSDWEVSAGKDYTYYYDGKYVSCKRGIYDAESDSYEEITSDKLFNVLTNNYYTSAKAGVDTREYLKDGYTFVGFGITVVEKDGKKVGQYDQFIINGDLDVVMSLTQTFGAAPKGQTRKEVKIFDLIMCGVDGMYYSPVQPGTINLYNSKGEKAWSDPRSDVRKQQFNSNVLVCQSPDPSSSSKSLYGAFDKEGNAIATFEYDLIEPYRGGYTIGRRYGRKDVEGEQTSVRKLYLLGSDGKEIQEAEFMDKDGNITLGKPLNDMAYKNNNTSITNAKFVAGCYIFRMDSGERTSGGSVIYKYGVRTFDPKVANSIIMPATLSSDCSLYSPSDLSSVVFVFDKETDETSKEVRVKVYRLS